MKRIIQITKNEDIVIKKYLNGKMCARELGKYLKLSHQGAINFVTSYLRQCYQLGLMNLGKKEASK